MNKMISQTSILDLPPEILRKIFQRIEFETTEDLRNFLIACEVYTDPRIFNILSQIQFDNEGILFSKIIAKAPFFKQQLKIQLYYYLIFNLVNTLHFNILK